uniref:Uncharacterized protein n=1 Tax=viral metagenome TaxID=1070528 RepID=A0A6C0BX44_9ZZZZ
METVLVNYNDIVGKMGHEISIPEIRQLVHKLVGVVLILEGKTMKSCII